MAHACLLVLQALVTEVCAVDQLQVVMLRCCAWLRVRVIASFMRCASLLKLHCLCSSCSPQFAICLTLSLLTCVAMIYRCAGACGLAA
jgi:hypothetical protein